MALDIHDIYNQHILLHRNGCWIFDSLHTQVTQVLSIHLYHLCTTQSLFMLPSTTYIGLPPSLKEIIEGLNRRYAKCYCVDNNNYLVRTEYVNIISKLVKVG